ncbi:hypothetical protein MRX96_008214 [Rhipicephalus microplus]
MNDAADDEGGATVDATALYLAQLNQRIRRGCTAHADPAGRIYYMNHETRTSSWLPPGGLVELGMYGAALRLGGGRRQERQDVLHQVSAHTVRCGPHFGRHVSKTTTYEDPRKDYEEEPPPSPREVELFRDPQLGFGFVAGSEKPVIVRFVTEGGPSEHKLQPGDQILGINGEDVKNAPREHVIELVKSCKLSVKLVVCQPHVNNTTRKSALLTAAKKAKLKTNPSRVRFAEGVVINGSPLYSPSTFESCVPFLPNVMKVFLENGQTKSFKYDSSTTVQDVLNSLQEKLSVKAMEHFGLVVEHIKSVRRNKLTLLDPKDSLAKIAARPGAHHLRCLFRVAFVPLDAYDLLQKDPVAFEYLFMQCCNDMVQERFAPELKYDVALKLAALHIHLHALSSGIQGKVTIKSVERESGLKRFVPGSLLETMKRKELRKLLSHFLKQNQATLCAPGQKQLTPLQAKLHYLKVISELSSYGAKVFATSTKDSSTETGIMISPKFGISQINNARGTVPIQPVTLAQIEEVSSVTVTRDEDLACHVEINIKDPDKENLKFGLDDHETSELVFILKGYHKLLASRDLPVHWETEDPWKVETAPCFHGTHIVCPTPWSYTPSEETPNGPMVKSVDLALPPPAYVPCELPDRGMSRSSSREQCSLVALSNSVDHNMNETSPLQPLSPSRVLRSPVLGASKMEQRSLLLTSNGHQQASDSASSTADDDSEERSVKFDIMDDDDEEEEEEPVVLEVKNEEVLRRVSEMRRMVADAESYLSDGNRPANQPPLPANESTSSEEREAGGPTIRAADSLLLLTQLDDVSEALNEVAAMAPDEAASESDTDSFSTPTQSPLHRTSRLAATTEPSAPNKRGRSGSSFGLHSPDMLPGIGSGDRDLLELLKQLQSNPDIQLPFDEGTLYLDPDIIDLTMIPPPMTPDVDAMGDVPGTLDVPPMPFSDRGFPGNPALTNCTLQATDTDQVDSARVVAELDNLCDALTEMRASGNELGCDAIFQQLGCQDLESFIASAVPARKSNSPALEPPAFESLKVLSYGSLLEPANAPSPTVRERRGSDDSHTYENCELSRGSQETHSAPQSLQNGLHEYEDMAFGKPRVPPRLRRMAGGSSGSSDLTASGTAPKRDRTGSCDNIQVSGSSLAQRQVARSHSWTNLQGPVSPGLTRKGTTGKPPLPPGLSFAQDHPKQPLPGGLDHAGIARCGSASPHPSSSPLTSRRAGSLRSGSVGRAGGRHLSSSSHGRYHQRSSSLNSESSSTASLLNGINGCTCFPLGSGSPSSACPRCQAAEDTSSSKQPVADSPFLRAQEEVCGMVLRLENALRAGDARGDVATSTNDRQARETLLAKSRQFVTASKVFVRSASENSEQVTAQLAACMSLLDSMCAAAEQLALSGPAWASLVEQVKAVAVAYARATGAVDGATVGSLMHQATDLASTLTALMRTLRSLDSS